MIRPQVSPEVFSSNVKEAKQEVFERDLEELLATSTALAVSADKANEDQELALADAEEKKTRCDHLCTQHHEAEAQLLAIRQRAAGTTGAKQTRASATMATVPHIRAYARFALTSSAPVFSAALVLMRYQPVGLHA